MTAVGSACPGSVTAVCRLLAIHPLPPDSTIAPWKHLDLPVWLVSVSSSRFVTAHNRCSEGNDDCEI
jgi:hypothetical protein